MKLIPCDIKSINSRLYKYTDNMKVIMEFVNSGIDCAKVENYPHIRPYSCANALNRCAERMNMPQIKAIVRKKAVYLVRVDKCSK